LTPAKQKGVWGENLALGFLENLGYTRVDQGYYTRFGEIDVIVRDDEYIVFVEVKMRRNRDFAEAREFVSAAKQRRVRTTAQIWLIANETDLQPRFDVIEIYAQNGIKTQNPEIFHIEDAFQ
jgi:putative endonuclease